MSILRADSIRDRAGTGAPDFPNGLTGNVTGNCSGTAGSTGVLSAGATGADLTLSGNLTVNGTTTTIDTAVTAVDSLAVDGNVTAGGNLGIGTVTAGRHLTVSGGASEGAIQITNNTSGHTAANGFELIHFTSGETQFLNRENGDMRFDTNGTERFRIKSGGPAIFKGGLVEKFQTGTTIQADPTIALSDGNIVLRTSNESGNQAINFTGVHSTLAIGEAVSFTVIITPNGSGAINNVQIDAATQVIQWSGGSAPSAGAVGSRDVYTFTILKTGSGTTDYDVYGAATNYA